VLNTLIQVLPVIYFTAVAVPLVITDIREHRLPNKLTLPAIPLTLGSWLALAVMDSNRWPDFAVAVGSAVIIFALGLGANAIGSLGMGDVKLAVGLVLMLAWFIGLWALLVPIVALVAVAVHILVGVRVGILRAGSSLAFGPHLIGSAVLLFGVGVF